MWPGKGKRDRGDVGADEDDEADEAERRKLREKRNEEKYSWNGGDFGVYMQEKERKLREQYAGDAAANDVVGNFLQGVVIWVDGRTVPGRDELRRLVSSAGGRLETYFHPRIVTHVVATHFPKFKVEQLRKAMVSSAVHQYVVTPAWVVESVAARKRLIEGRFLVGGMRDEAQSALTFREAGGSEGGATSITVEDKPDITSAATHPKGQLEAFDTINATAAAGDKDAEPAEVLAPRNGGALAADMAPTETDTEPTAEAEPAREAGSRGTGALSTRENPNFARDYFKSSRLHYIGSFRARYESLLVAVAESRGCAPADLLRVNQLSATVTRRTIIHVDMDCFFVSVSIAQDPSLAGLPLVVCHQGGGEISSASYEARARGVRAGMFFKEAIRLCPDLRSVHYDFDQYERTTLAIYKLFYDHAPAVEAVSVDEAYLDVTGADVSHEQAAHGTTSGGEPLSPPQQIAEQLRRRIFEATGCPASAGIASNKLLARLATKRAKPNGQFYLRDDKAAEYIADLPVRELPGVGWSTSRRLEELGIARCAELQQRSVSELRGVFGERTGELLHRTCRGIDPRPVEPMGVRKSLGAELSWGVRFHSDETDKVEKFIADVADVVAERLRDARAKCQRCTLKVYRRKKGAHLPYKVLGHGPCDIFNRSLRIEATHSSRVLAEHSLTLYRSLQVPNEDLRGIGIAAADLDFERVRTATTSKDIQQFLQGPPEDRAQGAGKHAADHEERQQAKSEDGQAVLPDNWDNSVFRALPASMREELLRDHRVQERRAQRRERGAVLAKAQRAKQSSTRQSSARHSSTKQSTILKFARRDEEVDTEDRATLPEPQPQPPSAPRMSSSDEGIHQIFGNEQLTDVAPVLKLWMQGGGDPALLEACLDDLLASHRLMRCVQLVRTISFLAPRVGNGWPERVRSIRDHATTAARMILGAELVIDEAQLPAT